VASFIQYLIVLLHINHIEWQCYVTQRHDASSWSNSIILISVYSLHSIGRSI